MHYMLDTNICIYLIKKKPESVLNELKKLQPEDLCISSVTLAELEYGVQKSEHVQKNKAALAAFILPLQIVSFDEQAAAHYGDIRAELEKKGKPIGPLDLMIAAHARALNLMLVTHNIKEFKQVPKIKVKTWVC